MNGLVGYLKGRGVLKTKAVIRAFAKVDRAGFVPPEFHDRAYDDEPLPIGFGQTISQPYTVAFMLELLAPKRGENILDVGAGSGWTTALLAAIAGPSGAVRGVEIVPELVAFGKRNLAKYNFQNAEIAQAGTLSSPSDRAPFDRILVSAASDSVPRELVDQLKIGGIMVIPVGRAIWQIRKISSRETAVNKFEGFAFVPLRPG